MSVNLLNHNTFLRLVRFASIGMLAASIHYTVVIICVQLGSLHPLIANIIGFLVAFSVSYIGQSRWTFFDRNISHKQAVHKYFITSITSFMISEFLLWLGLVFGFPYYFVLIFSLAGAAVFTFLVSSKWVFGHGK